MHLRQSLLKSKMFWVGVLYFAEGFPLGIFFDVLPVHFRQLGIDLRDIGLLSLVGLAWTLKFLWAPAVDFFRHHRRWMFAVDSIMGLAMLYIAAQADVGTAVWITIGLFALASATNDIAIDGYTIELLDRNELGRGNGLRIAFYRVGMLATGFILVLRDLIGWQGSYVAAAILFAAIGVVSLLAPRERDIARVRTASLLAELKGLVARPPAFAAVVLFLLGALWLANNSMKWSQTIPHFWLAACGVGVVLMGVSLFLQEQLAQRSATRVKLTEGPLFGALMEMLQRPHVAPVILFILLFKLADSSMGFMVKPFWVDAGFSATEIGLVSVNIGLVLSIAGGIAGGWYTDRAGIFTALWVLGLAQAVSNLGYAAAAWIIPPATAGVPLLFEYKLLLYGASALESFTGGLGTAAFLAFLMAIVDKKHSATEYALLSSIFALSRSVAGWLGGHGAAALGFAPYFLLTFFLAFPAYLLLPWVRRMLGYASARPAPEESSVSGIRGM